MYTVRRQRRKMGASGIVGDRSAGTCMRRATAMRSRMTSSGRFARLRSATALWTIGAMVSEVGWPSGRIRTLCPCAATGQT